MRPKPTVEQIMAKMLFPETETGPYVTELRKMIAREIEGGLMNRSAGTWGPEGHNHELRAREFLAADWAPENEAFSMAIATEDGSDDIPGTGRAQVPFGELIAKL